MHNIYCIIRCVLIVLLDDFCLSSRAQRCNVEHSRSDVVCVAGIAEYWGHPLRMSFSMLQFILCTLQC